MHLAARARTIQYHRREASEAAPSYNRRAGRVLGRKPTVGGTPMGWFTWRRFQLLLCLVMVAIAILRVITGNLIGAIIPALLAVVFGSIAADYPILSTVRRIWSRVRRLLD
jgi:hypothetical protein